MIFLIDKGIDDYAIQHLAAYQKKVDDMPTYPEKVSKAATTFETANKKGNKTFDEVKKQLSAMCCGPDRCNYCEDSKADEVEHIRPKSWYPDSCFIWQNYCYACGTCNSPKGNQTAVFVNTDILPTELERKKDDPITEPPIGVDVLINPRLENPLELLFLDLVNERYVFTERQPPNTRDFAKAEYTIRVLGLNTRSYLVKARKNAYNNFLSRLTRYIVKRDEGVPAQQIENIIGNFKEEHHQTVWQEMKRQYALIPELHELIQRAPEALSW